MMRNLTLTLFAAIAACSCTPESRAQYDRAGDNAGAAAQQVGAGIVQDAQKAGEVAQKGATQASVATANAATTAKVKGAITSAKIEIDELDVDTVGDTVYLRGSVEKRESRDAAQEIAVAQAPDKKIVNELKIKPNA